MSMTRPAGGGGRGTPRSSGVCQGRTLRSYLVPVIRYAEGDTKAAARMQGSDKQEALGRAVGPAAGDGYGHAPAAAHPALGTHVREHQRATSAGRQTRSSVHPGGACIQR